MIASRIDQLADNIMLIFTHWFQFQNLEKALDQHQFIQAPFCRLWHYWHLIWVNSNCNLWRPARSFLSARSSVSNTAFGQVRTNNKVQPKNKKRGR